jgi:hypothetical protein
MSTCGQVFLCVGRLSRGAVSTYTIIRTISFNLFGAARLKFGSVFVGDISLPLPLKVIEVLYIVLVLFDSLIDILYLCNHKVVSMLCVLFT